MCDPGSRYGKKCHPGDCGYVKPCIGSGGWDHTGNSGCENPGTGLGGGHPGDNRMGRTRDLLKKITDTKGTFHANMGTIKDRNGMELTEAEDIIKKRWQKYSEELKKKRSA